MAVQGAVKLNGNTALSGNDVLGKSMGSDRVNVGTVVSVATPSVTAPRDTPTDNGGGSMGVREMPASPVTPPENTAIPPELNAGSESNPLNSEVVGSADILPYIPADGERADESFEDDDPDGLSDGLGRKEGQGGKGIMVDAGLADDYNRYGEFGSGYGANGQERFDVSEVQVPNYNYRDTPVSAKKGKMMLYIVAAVAAVVGLYFLFRKSDGKRR